MIKINDYLYCGDTVLKILHSYSRDLKESAVRSHNQVDLEHVNYLLKITELLEHNDFLTSQSQRLREFYKHMADQYPFLAFTYKGRIKSLFRAEEKFNGNVVTFTQDYYRKKGTLPPMPIWQTEVKGSPAPLVISPLWTRSAKSAMRSRCSS